MADIARALVPKHPLPMRTLFRRCFLVNFAVDPVVMAACLPTGLEPDLHADQAWLSIVIAEMERMRPAFLPAALGFTYNQVVYRAVVRKGDGRGVYFLRSDADNRLISLAGDLLTFFRFHYTPMEFRRAAGCISCDLAPAPAEAADIHATYDLRTASRTLPAESAFADLPQAQQFLVELYTAFGRTPLTEEILRVRIKRGDWQIAVVQDRRGHYRFMQDGPLFPPGSTRLDSIFYVKQLPYYWYTLQQSRRANS
jgi:uncharacterized protein YqjF (DUF2071 family)